VTISSLCKSKTSNHRIHFHIISENDIGFGTELDLLQACEPDTQLDSLSVNETIQKLKDAGFDMSWLSPPSSISGKWGVETPYTNAKHASPLNLLRFYLPHLPSYSGTDKFIFLDDDIVVNKDIRSLWNFDLSPDKVMATGCQHWLWVAPGQFSSSTNMTVKETGYIGDLSSVCADANTEKDKDNAQVLKMTSQKRLG
jgi:lipopolysaccharide biosynthesis glycosyltransferase